MSPVLGGHISGCYNTRKYYATLRNSPSVCYENIQLAATYMSTQNWGHPAQLDYSSVTRPSLPREGLACETRYLSTNTLNFYSALLPSQAVRSGETDFSGGI